MAKKNEEKVKKEIAPTLRLMHIGETEEFPLKRMHSVKSTISQMKLIERKVFVTKQVNNMELIKVTRMF